MRKLFFIVSIIFLCLNLNARYGIGYNFFGRLVAKKVYASSKNNRIRISDIRVQSKEIADLTKDFEMKLSKKGLKNLSSAVSFNEHISHPKATTNIKQVLKINAKFSYEWNNYVELVPKNELILPKWIKSIDLWAYGIKENLDVYIYLSAKPNEIKRLKLGRLDHYRWERLYANIFDVKYKNERDLRLVKIRIVGHRNNAVKELVTYIAGLYVNNFPRNKNNIYLNPVNTLFNINEIDNIEWKLQVDTENINRNFFARVFDRDRDKSVLHINIPKDLHNELDTFVHFKKPSIFLKGYTISMWINGKNNREHISFIFRDRKKRLFEVEFAHITFSGWKRLEVDIPLEFFLPMPGYERLPYLTLWGIKISPKKNVDIEFSIDNIDSYKDFRF